MSMAAPKTPLYIGEGEEGAPPLGFPPLEGRQPQTHLWVAATRGEEREAQGVWALGPICP